jgi:hypothetical protein
VFDLEGKHQLAVEITTDSIDPAPEPKSLLSYIPFQSAQACIREINKARIKGERAAIRISVILGIFSVLAIFLSSFTGMPNLVETGILVGIFSPFLAYALISQFVLDRLCPWKKLILSAEYDGIIPKQAREKARAAANYFDHLYVIVDQQHRWKSTLLPNPRPRALDPLLIAELKQGHCRKFFLIDQFDLTRAEQHIADEFAIKLDETFAAES